MNLLILALIPALYLWETQYYYDARSTNLGIQILKNDQTILSQTDTSCNPCNFYLTYIYSGG